MVVSEGAINNIMGGMENTAGVRLHSHRHKLKQRFDIIKKLGQGTYGKVQLAVNKETGQEVAIKTIKKGKIETEQDLIRIRREIQIMSSVQHPQLIHIYEVFENRDKMVLVMEYAAGGELYDYLSERKVLQEDEARRVFRQVSSAVYYCHKHKICHRDLKLENILLDIDGNAKIADFGLSNVFDEKHRLDTFCGSPLYASPEIVKGIPYLGPEVDCWSLGVLLYTLVYGAMPFDGSNFRRLVKQITQGDFYEPATPSSASELIKHMLTVKSEERATIEDICNHWWVNEGFKADCLKEAEYLANQTPVRLDLLLSLAPKHIDSQHMLIQPDETDASKRKMEKTDLDKNLGDAQSLSANIDGGIASRSHSAGAMPPATSGSMDRLVKKKMREKSVDGSRENQLPLEKKEKKKKSSKKALLNKEDTAKNKSGDTNEEIKSDQIKRGEELDKIKITTKTDEEKPVKEKKKSKKRESGEINPEKKSVKKKSTDVVKSKSPIPKTSDELITEQKVLLPDSFVTSVSEPRSPEEKVAVSKEESKEVTSIPTEPLSPEEVKSPLEECMDTEKILLETAAKIEAVEAAITAERLSTSEKDTTSKAASVVGSPSSNKSSVQSSLVTSPIRSRTESESSGDRTSSSRRQSKIFSKAAMFDNLAAQNNSRSPPPEKPRRTTKPGTLNLTDLTKRFEEKASFEKKKKITTPVKVSDAKRAFESKADRSQPQSRNSRASSKSSNSQPASPPSKLNSPHSNTQSMITLPSDEDRNPPINVKITTSNQEDVTAKNKELSPKKEICEAPTLSKGKENVKPRTQSRLMITPRKSEAMSPHICDMAQPDLRAKSEVENITDNKPTMALPDKILDKNANSSNSGSRIRQVEIKLESSDSSDSESEAEKMLRTLTEKRERLELAKAEKLKMVTEAKDKELKRDMPAIKEEPRTPTPARHIPSTGGTTQSGAKSSTLPRGFKSKDAEILRTPVSVNTGNTQGDNSRKKTQMQITLNNSKSNVRGADVFVSRSPSRRSPEYISEETQNICEPAYVPAKAAPIDRGEPQLQRARRERIIPIMMEEDDDNSLETPTSSTASVPMYNASARVTPALDVTREHTQYIQKSRRERIIPIAVEGEGILTPPAAEHMEGNFRRTMHPTIAHNFGRSGGVGKSLVERSDSFSSAGEDDDDEDGFQILTAECLFSTLLSRVRSLTRKMADDPRSLRRAAVGEPGAAFWSSLHTPPGESSSRIGSDREDGFGTWKRSLSREPSDAESVFSDASSLPRAEIFRHRHQLIPSPSLLSDSFFRTS